MCALAGCSIFNPHVNPGIKPPYFPLASTQTRQGVQANADQDARAQYAGGVVEAHEYAHAWQAEYYDAVGNDSLLRNLTIVPVVGAAAAALVLGITSSSPDIVAALSVGGAAALGTSLFLQSAPRQKVYIEGYRAIGCAISATSPYVMPLDVFQEFDKDLKSLRDKREVLTAELNRAEPTLGSGDAAVIAAKEALARGATVAGNGQILRARIANAGRNLTAKVDDIAAQVSEQITETEPDAQAITSVVSNLSGVTGLFGLPPSPEPTAPKEPAKGAALQDFPPEQAVANDLRAKARDLVLATDLVNERVIAAESAAEEAGALEACVPGDAVPGLVVRPRVELLSVQPGQDYAFSAEGGEGAVRANFSGQVIGAIVQDGASFTLSVAQGVSGTSAIQFSDDETTRTIALVVHRGVDHLRPEPGTMTLAPADCAPVTIVVDRDTLLTDTEDQAGVTDAQVEAIQRGLNVEVDGRAGSTTRGAICRFEKDDPALEVSGEISQQLRLRFPVQDGEADDGAGDGDGESPGAGDGEDASTGACASLPNTGTAERASNLGVEQEITPRRLCDIQTRMGVEPTGTFDEETRQGIAEIREHRLREEPSDDLTFLTQAAIDVLFPSE